MTARASSCKVTFTCNEKLFEFTSDDLPEPVARFRKAWQRYNHGLVHGWKSPEDSQQASAAVDALGDLLFPFLRCEVNHEWLDEPSAIEPLNGLLPLTADNFGYELTTRGQLRVWGSVTVQIVLTDEVDPDELQDWLDEQHLADLFMLGFSEEIAVDTVSESSQVDLVAE